MPKLKHKVKLTTDEKEYLLSEAFAPVEARTLAKRLDMHHTPKHGSWLNIAEIDLNAMTKRCLAGRRIDNIHTLNTELSA